MTYHISNQFAWRKGCDGACLGRKGRCFLPFRRQFRGKRKFDVMDRYRGAYHAKKFWKSVKIWDGT